MLLVTTLSLVACCLLAGSSAEPQPQPQPPQGRPVYAVGGGGAAPPPRQHHHQQQQQQQQAQQYQQPSYLPGPQAGPNPYARPPNNYVINSSPKPVSIHQLPNPSPVQPPVARSQQFSGPPRQSAPSAQNQRASSSSLGEVQPVYGQAPAFVPPRARFQPTPQQQSKYSSQLKASQLQQGAKQNQLSSEEAAEYEDEEQQQEPDRLTLLLQESKFQCSGKKDGYYADDGLNCEVFHYCQDGGKHSWMCPNNFAFHQVHLICVPPSNDNICKQSSNYHFVNEYLYRPVNEKEAQATNTSLKYADRYYPDGYTPGTPLDEMLANYDATQNQHEPRAPASFKNHHRSSAANNGGGGDRNRNVFYSPESINIPLSQRRPPLRGSSQQQQQQPQQQAAKQPNSAQQYEEYEDEEY